MRSEAARWSMFGTKVTVPAPAFRAARDPGAWNQEASSKWPFISGFM